MSAYPQLTSGALSQFPIATRLLTRTVVNSLADGSSVKLADDSGSSTAWTLQYAGLSDAETTALQQFFATCEGSLNGFTFVDPAANLLAWSEDLTNSVWQPGPLLAVAGSEADPLGGTQAFTLTNSGSAAQGISQTLNAPGGYVYSFSVYIMASQPAQITLSIGGQTESFTATAAWSRISLAAKSDPSAASVVFSIQTAPGAVTVFGPQVDAQPEPSPYKQSTTGGVYQNARFQNDSLRFISTAPNQNSVTVNITYVDHL